MKIRLTEATTLEEVRRIIDRFPYKHELYFFDHFHPQISDPGAYVTVQQQKDGSFAYQLANHGWSGEWKPISKEELTAYIYKNRAYNANLFEFNPFTDWTIEIDLKANPVWTIFKVLFGIK